MKCIYCKEDLKYDKSRLLPYCDRHEYDVLMSAFNIWVTNKCYSSPKSEFYIYNNVFHDVISYTECKLPSDKVFKTPEELVDFAKMIMVFS